VPKEALAAYIATAQTRKAMVRHSLPSSVRLGSPVKPSASR
jgi:hypothetical protein